jgi:hypothetical protein
MSWPRIGTSWPAVAGTVAAFVLISRLVAADDAAPAPDKIAFDPTHCPSAATKPRAAIAPRLVKFDVSPFPYSGDNPADGKPFLDYDKDGQRGHTSPRGSLHLEAEAYSDRRSLLYLPAGFDLSRPEHALIVVFFHGNFARLDRDVEQRQRVPQQLARSGLNAALVAPQFAVDIADSSPGRFWENGVFKQYLAEAAKHLAELRGDPCTQAIFDRLGVVLVAYSGGYDPAAYALAVGGADSRIRGVILLDALYGETDKFDKWIGSSVGAGGPAFFFSAYSDSSLAENMALQRSLAAQHIKVDVSPHAFHLRPGSATFLFAGPGIEHKGFVTDAWVRDPLEAALSAIVGFRTAPRPAQPVAARATKSKARAATPQPK